MSSRCIAPAAVDCLLQIAVNRSLETVDKIFRDWNVISGAKHRQANLGNYYRKARDSSPKDRPRKVRIELVPEALVFRVKHFGGS